MDEKTMRGLAASGRASTRRGEIPAAVIKGYESRHPVTESMTETARAVWDSLDRESRDMIMSDRAYFGTDGSEEHEVSFADVLGLRQVD